MTLLYVILGFAAGAWIALLIVTVKENVDYRAQHYDPYDPD